MTHLQSENFQLQVWHVGDITRAGFVPPTYAMDSSVPTRSFGREVDVLDAISRLDSATAIFNQAFLSPSRIASYTQVLRAIDASPAEHLSVAAQNTPALEDTFLQRLKAHTSAGPFRSVPRLCRRTLEKYWLEPTALSGIGTLDAVWVGTGTGGIAAQLIGLDTRVFTAHEADYELSLNCDKTLEGHICFLDQMGPLHPDFAWRKIPDRRSSELWFSSIVTQLLKLQDVSQRPVVVAAHPKALTGQLDSYYYPIDVHYGQTANLVKGAWAAVVAEGSTSVNFAALFGVPLLVLSIEDTPKASRRANARISKELRAFESVNDLVAFRDSRLSQMLAETYPQYIDRHLKPSSSLISSLWESIADYLSSPNTHHSSAGSGLGG